MRDTPPPRILGILTSLTVKYLPTWVPGASFIKQAAAWREDVVMMSKVPFDDVKKQLVRLLLWL